MFSIDNVLRNIGFNWSFVFLNPVLNKPEGQTLLVSSMNMKGALHSRVTIIRKNNEYYRIGQLHLNSYSGKSLIEYSSLIRYKKENHKTQLDAIMDLNNPFYNIEWVEPISESDWMLQKKSISLLRFPNMISQGTKNTLWFEGLHIDWYSNDSLNPVYDFTQSLLESTLQGINNAYFTGTINETHRK